MHFTHYQHSTPTKLKKEKKKKKKENHDSHILKSPVSFLYLPRTNPFKKGRNPRFDFLRLFIRSSSYGHLPLPHHIHNTPRAST